MTDVEIDTALALEDAWHEWLPAQQVRDDEWTHEQREILAAFDRLEDEAWWDERAVVSGPLSYRAYLSTQTWKVRAARAKRWGYCVRCRRQSPTLDAHHLTYERLFRERPSDLVALCRRCHQETHGRLT